MHSLDSRLTKNAHIPWRLIDGEAILLDREEGEVIRLNPVAAEIWATIDGTRTVAEIVAHICSTFEVSERRARKDAEQFIKILLRHDLIQELIQEPSRL